MSKGERVGITVGVVLLLIIAGALALGGGGRHCGGRGCINQHPSPSAGATR